MSVTPWSCSQACRLVGRCWQLSSLDYEFHLRRGQGSSPSLRSWGSICLPLSPQESYLEVCLYQSNRHSLKNNLACTAHSLRGSCISRIPLRISSNCTKFLSCFLGASSRSFLLARCLRGMPTQKCYRSGFPSSTNLSTKGRKT